MKLVKHARQLAVILTAIGLLAATTIVRAEIEWFGSVYAKMLDGSRNLDDTLYGNTQDGFAGGGGRGGDQGQGIEFELLFRSQVSKQVEIGGRLKARFSQNFWTNWGGFVKGYGLAEEENLDEQNNQQNQDIKMRGVYIRLTPGYSWLDSLHFGSNDFAMFDAATVGKIRYIDRDNGSGIIAQGKLFGGRVAYDFSRLSLPPFNGPGFQTAVSLPGSNSTGGFQALAANDAVYTAQFKWNAGNGVNMTTIGSYLNDKEVDPGDTDNRDGVADKQRFTQQLYGLKANLTGFEAFDADLAGYYSKTSLAAGICNANDLQSCRFSPTLKGDADDFTFIGTITFNNLPFDLAIQGFRIGADFNSVTAARREADVLLTEGREGTWHDARPDYNTGRDFTSVNSTGTIGYGGWNGTAQQVLALHADNAFTDFDEPAAESAIGWVGVTIVPKFAYEDWEFQAEYSYITYDTNWQACGGTDKDVDCIYPRMEGTRSWGLGGDTRSPYAPYQDKQTHILALNVSTFFDVGTGLDANFRAKYISDSDNRLTNPDLLSDAYDGYPLGRGFAVNPDWVALTEDQQAVNSVGDDDRDADYYTLGVSLGSQVHEDLYVRALYEYHHVDLFDGSQNVAPVGLHFEGNNAGDPCCGGAGFGYAEYLSGQHNKHKLALQASYFLSGVEIGLDAQWFFGDYQPEFFAGDGQTLNTNAAGDVITPLGNISRDEVTLKAYRLKAFVKAQF